MDLSSTLVLNTVQWFWPSSYKAELFSILSAIATTPPDSLAKQHIISPYLNFNYINIYNPYHILQWEEEKFFVEQATQPFIKTICKAHILAMWSFQQRNQE
ncbi:12775_t:CDS:2 [Ambispora leptoticha]|uniref:12775_t:CDS:1 n=1 Tax=Ambispora leptoticha TaxID=144679 RepID=A0A9N9ANR8_9GLOM|nr:12775_t:CDS:2 [Ambispora leptoticha]